MSFAKVQIENANKVQKLSQDFSESKNKENMAESFTIIRKPDKQETALKHSFYPLFDMFRNKGNLRGNLQKLLKILAFVRKSFLKIESMIFAFLFKNSEEGKVISAEFKDFCLVIYNQMKKVARYIDNSDFIAFVPFLLKSIFSKKYRLNKTVSIDFKYCDIHWTNIPVSNHEVLCWWYDIMALIEHFNHLKAMLNMWYKHWLVIAFQVCGYIQLLDHECICINKIISKLSPRDLVTESANAEK